MGKTGRNAVARLSLAVCALAAFLAPACAPPPRAPSPAERLDAIVAGVEGVSPELSGLQVVVVKAGQPVFSYARGVAYIDRDGVETPLSARHKVRVASISKLVLAVGLMQLVETGDVDLDTDVSSYVGFPLRNPAFPDIPITLRQILAHTSSIRDADRYWLNDGQVFSDFFAEDGALFENGAHFAAGDGKAPGEYFEYSNLNFGVAAAVIERVSGERFDRYMQQRIFKPLGLEVGFSPCEITRNDPALLASLFRRNDGEGEWTPDGPWRAQVDGARIGCYVGMESIDRDAPPPESYLEDYEPGTNPTYFSPQGGLRASAEDLSAIMKLLVNRGEADGVRLLQRETVEEMLRPVWVYDPEAPNGATTGGDKNDGPFAGLMTSYGLSVNLADLELWGLSPRRRVLAGHLGEAYGLLGQFWFDPDTGDGVIALITGTGDDPETAPVGASALYRPQEEILKWWLDTFAGE
ncbi:MAG: serine hydrolase [Pseudomonadota bacterium]|nr:serine hydrolase [Pseudomonadota bacterium]